MANDREFVDRIEPQKIFWQNYEKIHDKNFGSAIIFYGEGGIGKTRLLKELAKEFNPEVKSNYKDIAYVYYDFENNFDTRTILLTMKNQLVKQGFKFPLFETGNFCYDLKINADGIDMPKVKNLLDKTDWLRNIASAVDLFVPGVNAAAIVISKIADVVFPEMIKYEKIESSVEKIKNKFEAARKSDSPNELYKLLPELFATDIKNYFDNAKREKKALIVFLDTYEKFVNDAAGTYEERARDLWLRGEGNSLMAIIPNTLWVIAGRSNLLWSGDYIKMPVKYEKISAFDEKFSKYFLESSGVANEKLREDLAKLTEGSPIFLTLCADIYEEYKNQKGKEPDISEFGGEREKVAKRILKYMDDFSQDMLKFLCILNTWTDDIANEIGNNVLAFSETSYERLKNFSFVQSEYNDIIGEKIYSFDRTVQAALIPQCSARMIERTKNAAAGYFYEILDTLEIDDEYFFNLMYWTKFLSRLSVDDEELYTQYFNYIDAKVQWLAVETKNYEETETIVNTYFEKIKDAENKNTKTYAAFEYAMGIVKRQQEEFYQEAFNYAYSAYKKFLLFPDEKLQLNYSKVMLADVFFRLKDYEKALTYQEEALKFYQTTTILSNNRDDNYTIAAVMNSLSATLEKLGRYEEAFNKQKKALEIYKSLQISDTKNKVFIEQRIIDSLEVMAFYANNLGHHKEALNYAKQAFVFKTSLFDENTRVYIDSLADLALGQYHFNYKKDALKNIERAKKLQKQYFSEDNELKKRIADAYTIITGGLNVPLN